MTVNPMGDALGDMKGAGNAADCLWHVISFASPVPIMLDAMAEAIDGKCGGGCLIAQLVGYSRKLTDGERRAAEARLMAKWLGKEHPDNGNFTSAITFAEGVDNVIDTDAEVVVFSEAQGEERRKAIDAMLLKKWRGTGAGAEPLAIALPRVSVAAGASFKFDIDGEDGAAALKRGVDKFAQILSRADASHRGEAVKMHANGELMHRTIRTLANAKRFFAAGLKKDNEQMLRTLDDEEENVRGMIPVIRGHRMARDQKRLLVYPVTRAAGKR